MFRVVQTSISLVFRLESEAGSGSMPVVISASRFKPSGYQFLQTLMWHSFVDRAALCTSVAPSVLKVKSWQGPYCASDSRPSFEISVQKGTSQLLGVVGVSLITVSKRKLSTQSLVKSRS